MKIINIALPVPLRRSFDYDASHLAGEKLVAGMRVLVPFGKHKQRVGIILGKADSTQVEAAKIKKIISVLDSSPVISAADLQLLQWTAEYYHHPIGEVIFNALPTILRQGKAAVAKTSYRWVLSELGKATDAQSLTRAPKQKALLQLYQSNSLALSAEEIESRFQYSRTTLNALHEKGLLIKEAVSVATTLSAVNSIDIELNPEQKQACEQCTGHLHKPYVALLDGVTGSGKTEVYIHVMQAVINSGKQVLILSPEIGLTPQLIERISSRINARVTVLHSALSDKERLQAWLDIREGNADIVIGTRSAIWSPLKNPGLYIVDEEHDLSYKQQDGLRYSARDIAVIRGKLSSAPVILGSATPSMESLHNVKLGKFELLRLNKRAANASAPQVKVIDLRNRAMKGAVSEVLLNAVHHELEQGKQVLLFLNRRGYAPAVMCHQCAWIGRCERCDVNMTYHKQRKTLSCHHCERRMRLGRDCPSCGANELLEIGHGTERLAETLSDCFPAARILRIDRDSTRHKGAMKAMLDSIQNGEADILIGTQMLAKGHHFPKLTLVGIIDIDASLCSMDFRASERMAQLFVQVSGRAGRETAAGTVMLQTHFPEHPQLQSLINRGYREFAEELLLEREQTNLPPFSYLALFRSEGHQQPMQADFLQKVAALLKNKEQDLQVYGPIPAPHEKKAGKIRMQLLVIANSRGALKRAMQSCSTLVEKLPEARKVRWSLDIDPQDMM